MSEPRFKPGDRVIVCLNTRGVVLRAQQFKYCGSRWYYDVLFDDKSPTPLPTCQRTAIGVIDEHMRPE